MLERLRTGIPGFDALAQGGLPASRPTLVAGGTGCGKTVFAAQFLAEGIRQGEPGVFVTFEEPPAQIRQNMRGFGWDIAAWEANDLWRFVDVSPIGPIEALRVVGDYDFHALIARIMHAIQSIGATRVALDSLAAVFSRLGDGGNVRRELFNVGHALREANVSALITAERLEAHNGKTPNGIEEFVVDNVIVLRHLQDHEKRRRTMEIVKFRGASHSKGQYPFTIRMNRGIEVIPLASGGLVHRSSENRISSGNDALDRMCGGGFFRDSVLLVSGPTGTGKTLTVSQFLAAGCRQGDRCLLMAFEESEEQFRRNAANWGLDLEGAENDGRLRIVCLYPEAQSLEDHLIRIREEIDGFEPDRLAMDSMSALERIATERGFREFCIGFTSFVKSKQLATLLTSTTSSLMGGGSVTEMHISTLTDLIMLLRYVEVAGEMKRSLTVLKMRGSSHDHAIREFSISERGMTVGEPLTANVGFLTQPCPVMLDEIGGVGHAD